MTVPDHAAEAFAAMAGALGVPLGWIGRTGGDQVVVEGQFGIPLDELRATWTATLPAALG